MKDWKGNVTTRLIRYSGNWVFGQQHGKGLFTVIENGILKLEKWGEWERGEHIRWFKAKPPMK